MTSDLPDLPDLPRPIARGGGTCHVLALQPGAGTKRAACGRSCGDFCGEEASFKEGMTHCPEHGEPLCPECCEIVETFLATGEWTGVEGDPESVGVTYTTCLDPHCPETVPASGCWCWEHIRTCFEPEETGCQHPAHFCEEPVHFCERHGGP